MIHIMPALRSLFVTSILGLTLLSRVEAATVVIITDESSGAKATAVATMFRSTPPFSRMRDLRFKVIKTSTSRLGCESAPFSLADDVVPTLAEAESRDRLAQAITSGSPMLRLPPSCNTTGNPISRLITCETPKALRYIQSVKTANNAGFAIVVKRDTRYGGSGGERVVITTGSPAVMAVHEFMHHLGFADEYAYANACEADIYCEDAPDQDWISRSGYGALPSTSFNVTRFNAFNSYINDADVRSRHGSKIHWLASISRATPLQVSGRLGTPARDVRTGLHSAGVCVNASRRLDTWQPVSRQTVMRTLSTNYIPDSYWPVLARSLGTSIGTPVHREVIF